MVFLFIISKGMHAETVTLANYLVTSNTMIGALFYNLFDNIQDGVCHTFDPNMQLHWYILEAIILKEKKCVFMKMCLQAVFVIEKIR